MYRLIVVDDEPNTCDFLASYIEGEQIGFQVTGNFYDGLQAWKYIQENVTDCVITDIRMPQMDGLELAHRIHDEFPRIKVLLLSGYGEFEYARKGIEYGVRDYLLKPLDYAALSGKLRAIWNELNATQPRERQAGTEQASAELLDEQSRIVIETAKRFVDEHYAEPISREQVAAICYMTPDYFGRYFKQGTGYTFGEYLVKVRMDRAIQFLHDNYTVDMIAQLVGYGSSRHFTRVFKKTTGLTPMAYRTKILKQELEK